MNALPVWNEDFTVRHTEVSREGNLRIDTFFDYMQEAAANHAANLGCGLADLEKHGMMWVLSRLRLRISARWESANGLP